MPSRCAPFASVERLPALTETARLRMRMQSFATHELVVEHTAVRQADRHRRTGAKYYAGFRLCREWPGN